MTHLQNIERNFTFTRKCTDNEERNEIGVSLSDSNEELGDKCLFDWNLINYWYNFQKHLHVFYQVRWSCWKIRHDDEYKLWLLFVKACRILTAPVITFRHFVLTHSSLMQFCKKFETKNGQLEVTPNMHLHSHLINCVVDYGPVHNFWLFSFERFNGVLGDSTYGQGCLVSGTSWKTHASEWHYRDMV